MIFSAINWPQASACNHIKRRPKINTAPKVGVKIFTLPLLNARLPHQKIADDNSITMVLYTKAGGNAKVIHCSLATRVVRLTTYPEVMPAKAIIMLPIPIHNSGLEALFLCC